MPPKKKEIIDLTEDDEDKLEVKESKIKDAGQGLFAKRAFKAGEKIIEYIGEELTEEQCQKRYKNKKPVYVLELKNKIIDAANKSKSNIARYANHKPLSTANAKFTETGWIKAVKKIKAGAEITVPYGPYYWRNRGGKKTVKKPVKKK